MKPSRLCALLLLAAAVQAAGETRLTPAIVNRLALSGNMELRAARQVIAEARARAKGSGRLSNPELGLEAAGGQDFEGRVEIALTQWFPVTSRLRWERKLSELGITMAELEVAEKERQLATAAQEALVEFAAAREAVALDQRQSQAAETEADALKKQSEEGLASSLDAGTGKLAADEILLLRADKKAGETQAASRLATLLGAPADRAMETDPLQLPSALPVPSRSLSRPDLKLAALAVENGDAEILLARSSRWQDIGVGLFAEGERNSDEPEGIATEGLLGMRVSVPFPLWQNGSAKVEEKRATRTRLAQQLSALELAAGNEAASSWRLMKIRYEAAQKAASTILPAARTHLTNTESARQRGEADMAQVFRARERLMQIERADLEARKAFHLSRVQWLSATGAILSQP